MVHVAHDGSKYRRLFFPCSIIVWLLGLVLGMFLSRGESTSMINGAIHQAPFVVSLMIGSVFPLIAIQFSLLFNKINTVAILCLFKSAALGYTGDLIARNYGSASWLICLLFQFSDYCCTILLFSLIFHFSYTQSCIRKAWFHWVLLLSFLITILDFFVISPFLIGLF